MIGLSRVGGILALFRLMGFVFYFLHQKVFERRLGKSKITEMLKNRQSSHASSAAAKENPFVLNYEDTYMNTDGEMTPFGRRTEKMSDGHKLAAEENFLEKTRKERYKALYSFKTFRNVTDQTYRNYEEIEKLREKQAKLERIVA